VAHLIEKNWKPMRMRTPMKTFRIAPLSALLLAAVATLPLGAADESGPAAAVVPLGELIVSPDRETALTARAALELIVHHAGRPSMSLKTLLEKIADKDVETRFAARNLAPNLGAERERREVAAELAKLVSADRPAAVKREALHLIAFIGGDAAVAPVAARLDDGDPTVREAARLSLERIPGRASIDALLAAAKGAPADRKPDLLFSLSKKGDKSVAKDLAGYASSDDGEVRFAALEGLARLGAPEAGSLIAAEIEKVPATDRGRLYGEYLRLADGLKAADGAGAAAIYRAVLAKAPLDHHREHALGALCPEGKMEGLSLLMAGLVDSSRRVRALSAVRLDALKGPEVLEALSKTYDSSKGEERPAILRAIAERDSAAAKPFLEKASNDANVELKITALDLLNRLDDPALEDVYRRTAESGPEWIRPTAVKGSLVIAKKKLDSGAKAEALPIFTRVLDTAREGPQRMEALRGLVAVGDPKQIGRLESLLQDPQLGSEAAQGFVAFAAKLGQDGDKDAAEKHLLSIVNGDFPRELKGKAFEELRKLGLDPQRVARAQGFVLDWWVVTPLPNQDQKGFNEKYFPEEVIELDKEHRIEARRYRWQRVKDVSIDGRIDLIPLFRKSDNVLTYAYGELESPKEQDVLFKMGSDDGMVCFLNGQKIHGHPESRGFKVDDDSVKAHLNAGVNKVLLKIGQTTGAWEFCFRVTDAEGKPLELKSVVK
jgi:HEAT repeat protein